VIHHCLVFVCNKTRTQIFSRISILSIQSYLQEWVFSFRCYVSVLHFWNKLKHDTKLLFITLNHVHQQAIRHVSVILELWWSCNCKEWFSLYSPLIATCYAGQLVKTWRVVLCEIKIPLCFCMLLFYSCYCYHPCSFVFKHVTLFRPFWRPIGFTHNLLSEVGKQCQPFWFLVADVISGTQLWRTTHPNNI